MNTPSAVPSGMLTHAMQAITKQKVQFLRALIDRPATIRQAAMAHATKEITEPMMMKNHPSSAGGAGLEGGPLGNPPDTIQAPIAIWMIGKQPISAVIPAKT